MRNIYLIISTISLALFLSACGGGGGGGTSVGGDSSTWIQITDCEDYVPLLDGDTVVKETDDTSVKIVDSSGDKTICVVSGAAHIVR